MPPPLGPPKKRRAGALYAGLNTLKKFESIHGRLRVPYHFPHYLGNLPGRVLSTPIKKLKYKDQVASLYIRLAWYERVITQKVMKDQREIALIMGSYSPRLYECCDNNSHIYRSTRVLLKLLRQVARVVSLILS